MKKPPQQIPTERIITVSQGGKVIYEGEDKRYYNKEYEPKPFGLSRDTWVKLAVAAIAGVGIYYRQESRISANEEFRRQQLAINESQIGFNKQVFDYIQNTDNYHSALTGQEFKGGRPTEGFRKNNFGKKNEYWDHL